MLSLRDIYTWLIVAGIFIIPFNSFKESIPFMGEFSREPAIIFFIPALMLYVLECFLKGVISFPKKSYVLSFLLLFLLWCIVCTLLNADHLFDKRLKHIFGIERFVRQLIAFALSLVVFLMFYGVFCRLKSSQILKMIRKTFSVSFAVVCFYSSLEFLIIYAHMSWLRPIIDLFDYFPFIDVYVDTIKGRMSSVTYEPPFLAMYLITVAGWMFSYILTSKSILRFIPGLLVIALGFLSDSRTALAVIFIQALVFASILVKESGVKRIYLLRGALITSCLVILTFTFNEGLRDSVSERLDSLNFKKNLKESISNKSRLGTQVASFEVFKQNPVIGVGFGQASYHLRPYYPKWATRNNYEFKLFYFNSQVRDFPPNYNMYTRIMAETGAIGFMIFASFLLLILVSLTKGYLKTNQLNNTKLLNIILLVSFIGFMMNWIQFDSFRIFGFWICLAILMPRNNSVLYD